MSGGGGVGGAEEEEKEEVWTVYSHLLDPSVKRVPYPLTVIVL
jgi:hypothetical protein